MHVLLIQGCLDNLTRITCELEEFANKRDLLNYCNIALTGLHYFSTAEMPTGGGDPTTAVVIAVVVPVVLVIILIGVVITIVRLVARCWKTRVQGDYDTGISVRVCEMYLYKLCAVFVL